MSRESGFAIIDLLSALAIAGLLAAVAAPVTSRYREKAYAAMLEAQILDVRSALAAGPAQEEEAVMAMGWSQPDGRYLGVNAEDYVAALRADPDTRMFFSHDSRCRDNSARCGDARCCIVDWVNAVHCGSGIAKTWMVWNNGDRAGWQWHGPGCEGGGGGGGRE